MTANGKRILGTLGAGLAACTIVSCAESPREPIPSVVLVTIDTLRADHLGCYGYPKPTSPAIDSLAAGGVRFHRAYSPIASTGPSHASLFSGLYPPSHGCVMNGMALSEEVPLWAELLAANGFETAAFTNNFPFQRHGLWRGFGTKEGCPDERAIGLDDDVFAWADRREPGRFFLWIHIYTVHTPYWPPHEYVADWVDPDYGGRFWGTKRAVDHIWNNKVALTDEEIAHLRNLYDSEIAYLDDRLRDLLGGLDERGLFDDALFVFTSDHGESFSHGYYAQHEPSVYESALRVPLFFRFPAGRHAGTEIDTDVVELVDVMPTVFELLGVPAPGDLQGRSLVECIEGGPGEASADSFAFAIRAANYEPHHRVVVTPNWKLIVPAEGEPELYALAEDPEERENRFGEDPDRDEALEKALRMWSEGLVARAEGVEITHEPTLELLESLGYVR